MIVSFVDPQHPIPSNHERAQPILTSLLDRLPSQVLSDVLLPYVEAPKDLRALAGTERALYSLTRLHVTHRRLCTLNRWLQHTALNDKPPHHTAPRAVDGWCEAARAAAGLMRHGPLPGIMLAPDPQPGAVARPYTSKEAQQDLHTIGIAMGGASIHDAPLARYLLPEPLAGATHWQLSALRDYAFAPLNQWQNQPLDGPQPDHAAARALQSPARTMEWLLRQRQGDTRWHAFTLYSVRLGLYGPPPLDLYLPQLTGVILFGCELAEVPEVLGRLPNLKTLDLSHNLIAAWPAHGMALPELKRLTLNDNLFETMPEALLDCAHLEKLALRDNQLTQLPQALDRLERLTSLDVRGNPLNALPERLIHLKGLVYLDVRATLLTATAVPVLESLVGLEELWVDGYLRRVLPQWLRTRAFDPRASRR